MPELVGEVPDPGRWWKGPALEMARQNPFQWVRCDGAHESWVATNWLTTTGPGPLPDRFEVKSMARCTLLRSPMCRLAT